MENNFNIPGANTPAEQPARKPLFPMNPAKPIVDNQTPSVSIIPATKRSVVSGAQLKQQTDINVAAYCRVSTGNESQQTSFKNQRAFYAGLIHSKPGWKFAGIYADEGISGTSTAHRDQFNQMIADAKAGKIDYIVTKSISRFARNTVTTLSCARELRQLNPPVGIYFEKENIDTLDPTGELILTIMSAMAQDESRSTRDNIVWAIRKKFQAGIPHMDPSSLLGYEKGPDNEWVINEEQAVIVRRIFNEYISGKTSRQIAMNLNKDGIKTPRGKEWVASGVIRILNNEKYVGDVEMQKTVTMDFLTHKAIKNHGEAPKYYVENHHKGIIDRVVWDKVQATMKSKGAGRVKGPKNERDHKPQPPFSNLVCGATNPQTGKECGHGFFRVTYSAHALGYTDERSVKATGADPERYADDYKYSHPVWICKGRHEGIQKYTEETGKGQSGKKIEGNCPSETLNECALKQSFMEMLYTIKRDYVRHLEAGTPEQSEIAILFNKAYEEAYNQTKSNSPSAQRLEAVNAQIREFEKKLDETIDNQVRAMREEALDGEADLNEAIANGFVTIEDIDADIKSELTGESGESFYHIGINEDSEAEIYAKLAADLRDRIGELEKERNKLEAAQGVLAAYKKNFEFFIKCIMELPNTNNAGMKIIVNGLDCDGSIFRDGNGQARPGKRSSLNSGHFKLTPERVEQAPDFLNFERGIYAAFITKGAVLGDAIVYYTNFGVRLLSTGNSRSLGSFIGFKKCGEKGANGKPGTVEILDATYKVDGGKIRYSRREKKRWKGNESGEEARESGESVDEGAEESADDAEDSSVAE